MTSPTGETGSARFWTLSWRLQGEAEKVDGRVHVLLGNHEVMNMMQDLRYVSPEGFDAFRAEEDPPGAPGGVQPVRPPDQG